MDGLARCYQEVHGAQSGDGSAKVRIFPNRRKRRENGSEMIQAPSLHPWKNHEEASDFERQQDEADRPDAAGTAGASGGGGHRIGHSIAAS